MKEDRGNGFFRFVAASAFFFGLLWLGSLTNVVTP